MANEIERFQLFCRKYLNRKIKEHFKDLGDVSWVPDFASDRHMVRWVCTHQDKDPMTLTLARLLIYFFKVQGLLEEPMYAMPCTSLHESNYIYPQVIINFRELPTTAKQNNRYPVQARHAIRYKGDYTTKADVERLAQKIRSLFVSPNRFYFDKGEKKYTYRTIPPTHQIITTTPDEAEAKKVIEALLAINSDTPNWEYLNTSTANQNFRVPGTLRVASETFTKPKRRPLARVYFTNAQLSVAGLTKNICLVDTQHQFPDAVLYVI